MSHFTVLVIGDNPEEQLAPFQENNSANCPKEYLEFHDVEQEYRNQYKEETRKEFYCSSNNSWGRGLNHKNFKLVIDKSISNNVILDLNKEDGGGMDYFEKGKKYSCYEKAKEHRCPDTHIWIEVIDVLESTHPTPGICFTGKIEVQRIDPPKEITLKEYYPDGFESFIKEWAGYEKDAETGKYGYWENPNAKWDWHQLGGKWNGYFKIYPRKTKILSDDEIGNKMYREFRLALTITKKAIKLQQKQSESQYHTNDLIEFWSSKGISGGYEIEKRLTELRTPVYIDTDVVIGQPGFQGTIPDPGRADQCFKNQIDFDSMYLDARKKAIERYERTERIFGGKIPELEHSWKVIADDDSEFKDLGWDEKGKLYNKQPGMKRLKEVVSSPSISKENKDFISSFNFNLGDYQIPKELFAKRAGEKSIVTFAVIKDGKWYERGKIGWWACVSNEKDDKTWETEFNRLIKDLPENTKLSVYDCHI